MKTASDWMYQFGSFETAGLDTDLLGIKGKLGDELKAPVRASIVTLSYIKQIQLDAKRCWYD